MSRKIEDAMSAQEYHDKKFKDLVVKHYEKLILEAEKAEDAERLKHLTKRFEQLEAGDLSIAKNFTFVISGSKLYYDELQNRVMHVTL